MQNEQALRKQLADYLDWHHAHADFTSSVKDFPPELRGRVPQGLPHSAWQLLEHIRIALWDILEFSRGEEHQSPKWPEGYWPKTTAPTDDAAWDASVQDVMEHLEALRELVRDSSRDLFAPLPNGKGQTLLREILLVQDHNAYHLGQILLVRKALGAWKG